MRSTDNRRYRQAAADYLSLPLDHPVVIQLAWEACQAADLAAFAVLRAGAKPAERIEKHVLPRDLASV